MPVNMPFRRWSATLLLFVIPLTFGAENQPHKQTISDLTCRVHKNRMDMALRWRAQDMPVSYVEDALFDFDAEDDIRTLRFLRAALRQIYADAEAGREYLDSGRFEADCVKIHRGY